MAGDGPLHNSIEQAVGARRIKDRVLMPGLSANVPSLMVHGFDVHLLPSLHEGLPIVGLEATAAGLYTVCSDTITKDFTDYFASRVKTVALDAEPSYWADLVEEAAAKRIPANEGIALIEQSPFYIKSSTQSLIDTYQNSLETNTFFKSKSQINAIR
jgi:glycosyltransferase involved in cell wall biosynthesis